MTELWVARHARVLVEGVCYGRSDLEVCVSALDACAMLVEGVPSARAPRVVWSSPSARCREPAALVAQHFAAELRVDPDLFELDFGAFESRRWDAIAEDNRDAYERWSRAFETVAPPGGERAIELEARVRRWVSSLDRTTTHALVAHAGVVRALMVIVQRASWRDALREPIEHLTWTRFCLAADPRA